MSDSRLYDGLRKALRGSVVVPGDVDYDLHRRIWNRDVDRHPAAIARCLDEDDVRAAVRFAVDTGVEDVAVRGGGHSYPGLSTCDGGLVIDLGLMREARAGEGNRVFVQGGAHIAHLDALTTQMDTAVPAGVEATTGIAGLTLGGGVGLLQRRYGLTCDTLRSVRMVTADGEVVVADDDTEPELMWGLRGGGGNFGIVTEFEFQSFPIGPYLSSLLIYPREELDDFVSFFDDYVADLPNEMSSCTLMLDLPPGMTQTIRGVASPTLPSDLPAQAEGDFFAVSSLWVGQPDGMAAVIEPLAGWKPVANLSHPTTHIEMQSMMPEFGVPQNRYVRAGLLDSLGTGVVRDCMGVDWGKPPGTQLVLSVQGGAIADVGEQDTAFSGRTAKYLYAIEASWVEPSEREPTVAWVRQAYDAIEKFATGGNYTNTITDEGSLDGQGLLGIPPREERVRRVFGDAKFRRLQRLKSVWDPSNLFHVNVNIPPAT